MVQSRKTRPCLTERLLMGRKESNQTKQTKQYLMQWQHYITHSVRHQYTYNYSVSAIDYNNYINIYDLGTKHYPLFLKLPFLFTIWVEIEKWNIKADVYPCHSKKTILTVTGSVPNLAKGMPIHMAKPAWYPKITKFDEETILLMWVTYATKVFNPYQQSVLLWDIDK